MNVSHEYTPAARSLFARYGLAVVAVAVTVAYGGLGPGLASIGLGWSLSWVFFVGEPGELDVGTDEELLRWGTSLGVAAAVVWVAAALRRGHERAGQAVGAAEASIRDLTALQHLATSLSAAATPSQVAQALIDQAPRLVGARGGSLSLIEAGDVVIVDPQSDAPMTHAPGFHLPLHARAPIAQAASTGKPIRVPDRETFEREYPDGAALSLFAHGALAVPLRAGGEVVGSMSFLYDEDGLVNEDAESIALIAADLGGQALERSRLYARERESRRALDRILQVAPRFHADTPDTAAAVICAEARTTFGSDFAMLWRIDGDRLELMCAAPALDELPTGLYVPLADFPRLRDAVERVQVSFVPDVQIEAQGEGRQRTNRLGIHSSLRTPIALAGEAELVLIVAWGRVLPEPDPSVYALARRFADQAGLALEQVERRRAEEEAAGRADETRRLQEITAALSIAATATDVSDTCLEHALAAVRADAGFIVLSRPEGVTVDVVTSTGYADDEIAAWGGYALDANVPFARAIAGGEAIWALEEGEMAAFADAAHGGRDRGWAAIPLRTPAGIRGALHLAFHSSRTLTVDERRWLQTVVSQCAQALERSRLFDAEQVLRRRSERLQSLTAALSNALTRADVADVIVNEIGAAMGADGVALAVVSDERELLRTLAWRGFDEDRLDERFFESDLDAVTPGTRALRRRVTAFYPTYQDLLVDFPDVPGDYMVSEHTSYLFVPLVAGRRANALLVLSWAEQVEFAVEERRFVETLAGQAAQAIDRAGSFETEQTIAETLQRSVLPVSLPRVEGVQLAARYLPGTAELDVGGDWFDALSLPDGRLGLVVGDVVGKGVTAAATMAQLRNAMRAFSLDRMKPSSTIARLNRLAEAVVETAFATIVYVVIDPAARIARVTSAGHPPPLVLYPDGTVTLVEGGRGLPLGAGPDTRYRHAVVELPVGTVLLLYTDGLIERRGRPIDEGLDALTRAAAEGPSEPEDLVEHILNELVGEGERGDDIALLAMRLLAVAPQPFRLRVPSDAGSLDLVRDALRTWLSGAPLDRGAAHDVVLATWEACANAIEHALDPREEFVEIGAEILDGRVRITVEDTGRWTPESDRPDRGLGLQLIRASMSSLDVEPGEAGTRVTFEKTLAVVETS